MHSDLRLYLWTSSKCSKCAQGSVWAYYPMGPSLRNNDEMVNDYISLLLPWLSEPCSPLFQLGFPRPCFSSGSRVPSQTSATYRHVGQLDHHHAIFERTHATRSEELRKPLDWQPRSRDAVTQHPTTEPTTALVQLRLLELTALPFLGPRANGLGGRSRKCADPAKQGA